MNWLPMDKLQKNSRFAVAVGFLLSCMVAPQTACASDLAAALEPLIKNHRGKVAVAVKHLKTGEEFNYHADQPMPTASLIKLPIMIAAYQAVQDGTLTLDQMVVLKEEDKVPGSGVLTPHFSAGSEISLRDAIQLMIAYSDNTATNLVIDQLGLAATTQLMQKLGCTETRLNSKVFRRETSLNRERSEKFGLGSTTAADLTKLLEQIHDRKLVSKQASEKMVAHLLACNDRSKIVGKLSDSMEFAHKGGSVSAVRTDAGILETPSGPIIICVLTADNEDQSWTDENEAQMLCAEIGGIVYRHFNSERQQLAATVARVLKMGSGGSLVESLQRTLNARLDPSPRIGVDGDFGPETERTVLRFQKEKGLPTNGEVGPQMWRALGPLVTEDEAVADPGIVNSEAVAKVSADRLEGPPFVTCKAWAIADGKTGELLWGFEESKLRDPASITKIMTAYLVASLAENDPTVLEETVTFSQRADDTTGSTADVRAGEQLSVGDLLYGLMLPSGNDASVALAEHFGSRVGPQNGEDSTATGQSDQEESYAKFIEAMNWKAREIGMVDTGYANTHGLTAERHKTTAQDMVILGYHAMQLSSIRERVRTPQYGCTVGSLAGYERNVLWRGTNRLLKIEGYDGVKTGTTGRAGACLVSRGHRGDRSLIVVTLGSSSSDARYADTRNLYRWAWMQLENE